MKIKFILFFMLVNSFLHSENFDNSLISVEISNVNQIDLKKHDDSLSRFNYIQLNDIFYKKNSEVVKIISVPDGYVLFGKNYNQAKIDKKPMQSAYDNSAWDTFVLKIDNSGKIRWEIIIDTYIQNIPVDIINTVDGSLFLVGKFYEHYIAETGIDFNDLNLFCYKISKTGHFLFEKTNKEFKILPKSILINDDKEILMLGIQHKNDIYITSILKLTEFEILHKEKKNIFPYNFFYNDLIKKGKFFTMIDEIKLKIIKLNDKYKIIYYKNYIFNNKKIKSVFQNSISIDKNNKIITTGSVDLIQSKLFGLSKEEIDSMFIFKSDSDGNPEWFNTYSYNKSIKLRGMSILQTRNSGYVVGGNMQIEGSHLRNMVLLYVDENGEYKWIKKFEDESVGNVEFKSMVLSEDGSSIIFAGDSDRGIVVGKVLVE